MVLHELQDVCQTSKESAQCILLIVIEAIMILLLSGEKTNGYLSIENCKLIAKIMRLTDVDLAFV